MRPFRFGLQAPRTTDPDEWLAVARRAEQDGYSTLLVPDHVGRLSTFPALMAAAAVTERIRVGTYVLNQDFRPPAVLAQEAAAVQMLTNGRLELGVGAGWAKHEYAQTGIQFDAARVRVARFDEYLQVVKGAPGGPRAVLVRGQLVPDPGVPAAAAPGALRPAADPGRWGLAAGALGGRAARRQHQRGDPGDARTASSTSRT